MDYKYNELDYAKNIYENGFQSEKHMPTELRLVATYIRRELKCKLKELPNEMYKWCESHIPGYKKEIYYKMINRAINQASKKDASLINVSNIVFYNYEIDYIDNLFIASKDDHDAMMHDNESLKNHILKKSDRETRNEIESELAHECKKVVFTLLFKMKVNKYIFDSKVRDNDFRYEGKYFKGGRKEYNELKQLAKLQSKTKINEDIINLLWINNIVTPMFGGMIKLNFMDELYTKNGIYKMDIPYCIEKNNEESKNADESIAIKITDCYDVVGWYYDKHCGDKKIAFCGYRGCNKIFRKKSNRQEYCSDECSKKADREKAKNRMNNIRNGKCSI